MKYDKNILTETLEVYSTAISTMTYFKVLKSLNVEFTNGRLYTYKNVPLKSFKKLKNSRSVGRHFNKNIRNNYELG